MSDKDEILTEDNGESEEAVEEIPKTRLCKCGKKAEFIKDYWVTEAKKKKEKTYDEDFSQKVEYTCGIIRRRFCPECLSKMAKRQKTVNRKLNAIIILSLFIPLALLVGICAYDYAKGKSAMLVPLIISSVLTVFFVSWLTIKLAVAQKNRGDIANGNYSSVKEIDALIDSLNFGLDDAKKLKEVPSTDVISDGDGRINYDMARSGFNMRVTLDNPKINIEAMTERLKYPFKNEAEYVRKTYVNAGLHLDNMKAVDDKELSEKDFAIKNGVLLRYSGLAVEIVIPEGVQKIAEGAFKNTKNCEKIVIPDCVREIERDAFNGCPATEVKLPAYLKEIKPFAFYRSAIRNIEIPDGVEKIDDSAFMECFSLQGIKIPASCKKIDQNAFKGCLELKKVEFEEGIEAISDNAFNGCTALKTVDIPDGVYEIGNFAFENCTSLQSLTLPDTIQFMGGRAFDGNVNMTIYGNKGSYAEQYAEETRRKFVEFGANKRYVQEKNKHARKSSKE